jgi:hypothetical protein
VQMALAIRTIDLDRMVFVQYPTEADPADRDKVVPDPALATALLNRVHHDQRVALGDHALAVSATAAPVRSAPPAQHATGSPGPAPSATDGATIDGLTGTTASQRTCTVTRSAG